MEVQHRSNHRSYVPEDVDEQRLREELAQTTNIEGIFRRAVHPSRFCVISWDERMVGNTWASSVPPTFSIKADAMAEDQVVDTLAKDSEEFCFLHIHRTQQRVVPARSSNLIINSQINGQLSYPVRFLERNNIRVLT
jgi:hypothetical protein